MGSLWSTDNNIKHLPLFPLVDMLFSAAGIFLILITVTQVLKTKIQLPPRVPDAVIICKLQSKYEFHTKDTLKPVTLLRYELINTLKDILLQQKKIYSIVIAFDAETFYERSQVNKEIRKLRQQHRKKATESKASGIEIMWWPMENPEDVPPIIFDWAASKKSANE